MNKTKSTYKRSFATIIIFIVYIFLLGKGELVSLYIAEGAKIFFNKVFPAIFPFVLLTKLLIDTSAVDYAMVLLSKITNRKRINPYIVCALILCLFSGFPTGAVIAREMNEKKQISKEEADIILPALNCASPGYVCVVIGNYIFKSVLKGFILWLFCAVVNVVIVIFLLPKNKNSVRFEPTTIEDNYSFSESFVTRIKESIFIAINVFSLNVTFYLISKMTNELFEILNFSKESSVLKDAFIELSCGIFSSLSTPSISNVIAGFAVGFGGLCVLFQVKDQAHKNADLKYYLLTKLVCGLLCAVFAFFLL